mgnify:CR=1 FL=1
MHKIKNYQMLLENSPYYIRERKIVLDLIEETLATIDTDKLMKEKISLEGNILKITDKQFDLSKYKDTYVIGAGKAAWKMAKALKDIIGDRIKEGWINSVRDARYGNIRVIKAGHPIPNQTSLEGTKQIMRIAKKATKDDLIICLISGGGSSLMILPAEGISLQDLINMNRLFLKSDMRIQYINCIRKHLSQIKGGLLAKAVHPATLVSLIISDVVGDKLDVIASGPTAPDGSQYRKAIEYLKKFWLWRKTPATVKRRLLKGAKGLIPETPKEHDKIFEKVTNIILLNNYASLAAMRSKALEHGLDCEIYSNQIEGEARVVGLKLLIEADQFAKRYKKDFILLSGGETTVTVKGDGKGGRKQEVALGTTGKIAHMDAVLGSFGSDGIDGFSKAAGAIVDTKTMQRAQKLSLDYRDYLENNDSNHFFKILGDEIITGHTGTNVMDFQIIYIPKRNIVRK